MKNMCLCVCVSVCRYAIDCGQLVEKNKKLRQINGWKHLNKTVPLKQNTRLVLPMPAGVYVCVSVCVYICVSVCIYIHTHIILCTHIILFIYYMIYLYYIHIIY
jgi:hypothetical protein